MISSSQLDPTHLNLLIHADIDMDQFDAFALPLLAQLDCRLIEKQWGADRHQWLLDFEGTRIWLHYEFYGHACWLHVEHAREFDVLTAASLLPGTPSPWFTNCPTSFLCPLPITINSPQN